MLNHVISLYDNVHLHIAMSVTTVLQESGWEVLNHPSYSFNLGPPGYDLFPKVKEPFQGIRFGNLYELCLAVTREKW